MALATGGFLWTIFAGMGIYLISTENVDATGKALTMYLACLAVGGYVSAVLVWKRIPLAVVPAVIVAVFYIIFVPLGTIVGVIIFTKLFAEDTRRYLA